MIASVGLPETVRVKISSEAAEYVSLTPVVAREMTLRELVELMLGVAGKDPVRIRELLLRGSLVSGASRLRWEGFDAGVGDLAALVAGFPDADPSRAFVPSECTRVVLRAPGVQIEITRDVAAQKRALRRQSFWDVLLEIAGGRAVRYLDYSHRDRGDRYAVDLEDTEIARLRESAGLLRYSSLEEQVRRAAPEILEFVVPR